MALDLNTKLQFIADSQVEILEKVSMLPDMQKDIREIKNDIAALAAPFKTHVQD